MMIQVPKLALNIEPLVLIPNALTLDSNKHFMESLKMEPTVPLEVDPPVVPKGLTNFHGVVMTNVVAPENDDIVSVVVVEAVAAIVNEAVTAMVSEVVAPVVDISTEQYQISKVFRFNYSSPPNGKYISFCDCWL